jgi:predicted nucleotidyltransferase
MADTVLRTRNPTRTELVAELRALEPEFVREGVTHMTLFGSRARGDNRPDSDVDLVIEVAEGRKFSLLDLVGVGHTVEDHIGLASSILMRRSLAADFLDELRRDGVDIF